MSVTIHIFFELNILIHYVDRIRLLFISHDSRGFSSHDPNNSRKLSILENEMSVMYDAIDALNEYQMIPECDIRLVVSISK